MRARQRDVLDPRVVVGDVEDLDLRLEVGEPLAGLGEADDVEVSLVIDRRGGPRVDVRPRALAGRRDGGDVE